MFSKLFRICCSINPDDIDYNGHSLTWLEGEFTLELVSVKVPDYVSEILARAGEVERKPELTNKIVGLRFFNLVHEEEGHRKANHRVYVSNPTLVF